MKRRLVTSALPYVNNIPHLGNLIQVLSADVFARFCRLKGYETLYICGTDEYGTATETKALELGVSPRELCDKFHNIHKEVYKWFNIDFDYFGRTSTPKQTEITQEIFLELDKNGYLKEETINQLYCGHCGRFLADRYVKGVCPNCGYEEARGDQCENCGKLLDPTDLIRSRCGVCGSSPALRSTKHLYIDLCAIRPMLEKWIDKRSVEGFWSKNALQMTRSWIRDGLKERCITRDLKWGIPVPKDGFRDKVFYVWFDAPIGYISITANYTDDWRSWWQDPDNVELYQFIGKDNIPFHTVIFPSSLLGSGENWTMLYHISSSEYLNYEGGKFSKSKGMGVFGTDAKDTGIPADVWRFYIFYNRPEKSDSLFTWKDFQEKSNAELAGNLGNLVNRTITFVNRFFGGKVLKTPGDSKFWKTVRGYEAKIEDLLERAELREAFIAFFELSSFGNKTFQDAEPWKMKNSDPEGTGKLLSDLIYLIRDLGFLAKPYMPSVSDKILSFLGAGSMAWKDLGSPEGEIVLTADPEILFTKLEDDFIERLREKYSGIRTEGKKEKEKSTGVSEKKAPPAHEKKEVKAADPEAFFNAKIALKIAKIMKVEKHPEADKLYIETIDDGSGSDRIIVSGLVPFFAPEELLGRSVIIADNLKPRKMRGIESRGMLLAADYTDDSGKEHVEVLDCPWAAPGTPVVLEGSDPSFVKPAVINADDFFSVDIVVKDHDVTVGGKKLLAAGKRVVAEKTANGGVH